MNVTELIAKANLAANGKATPLAPTSPRYTQFLAIANMMQDDWLSEPGIQWQSRYERLSLGTITSDRVDMDDDIYEFSKREDDYITIISPTDPKSYAYFSLVSADELRRHQNTTTCAIIGDELVFAETFETDNSYYGGEVIVPVIMKLDPLVNPSDEVLVDDPNWLVYMTAAERVRNTVTKIGQFPALVQKANNLMIKMREKNDSQVSTIPLYNSVLGETFNNEWGYNN